MTPAEHIARIRKFYASTPDALALCDAYEALDAAVRLFCDRWDEERDGAGDIAALRALLGETV